MGKTYKLTEAQAKLLSEHLKKSKQIVEGMSPEAAQYYAANPEALAEKQRKEEEEAAKLAEQEPQQATDPVQQIVQAAQALAQQQSTGTSAPAEEPAQPAVGATSAPAASSGPQPAPTGDEPSPDSTEALQAKAAQTQTGMVGEDAIEFEEVPTQTAPAPQEPVTAEAEEVLITPLVQNSRQRQMYHSTNEETNQLFGLPAEVEINDVYGHLDVYWNMKVEKNENNTGVARLILAADNVTGQLQAEYMNEHDQYQYSNPVEFNAKTMGFNITMEMSVDLNGFKPRSIDVDWKTKSITID